MSKVKLFEFFRKNSGVKVNGNGENDKRKKVVQEKRGTNSRFVIFLEILNTLFSVIGLILVVNSYGKYELYMEREVLFLSMMGVVFLIIFFSIFFSLRRLIEASYKMLAVPYLTGMGMFIASPWKETIKIKYFLMKKNFTVDELQWAIHCRFNKGTPFYPDFAVHYKWEKAIEITGGSLQNLEAKVFKDLQLYWMLEAHPGDLWWSGAAKFAYPTVYSTWWLMGLGFLAQLGGFVFMAYYFKQAGLLTYATGGKVDELSSGARRAFYSSMEEYQLGFSNWSERALWATMSMSVLYQEMLGDYQAFQAIREDRFHVDSDMNEYHFTEDLAPFIERDKKGYIEGEWTKSIRVRQLPGWPTLVPGKWVDPIKGKPFKTLVSGAYFPKESEWKSPWE